MAVVAPPSGLALRTVERPGLPAERRERIALDEAQAEAARPFDLATGPVARASLLSFDSDDHALLVTVHHIAADGWSLGILVGELAALYAALGRGEPAALPELPVQFADHAAWQRERMQGESLDRQLAYWREHLRGAPAHTELPADRPRPRVQRFRGERVHLALDAELAGQLRALGSAQGATLFMTLLAGFDALVFRQSGQEDVVVGSPVTGRPRRELEHVVGPFLNTVALRVSLAGEPSFRELIARVREAAVGALQHQDVPFEKVLDDLQPPRDLSRTPLFQLFFNMLNFPVPRADFDGLRFEPLRPPDVPSKFDLTVYASESGGGIDLELVYNADLFDRARIEELAAQYDLLLRRCAGDPDGAVTRASLVTAPARRVLPDPMAALDASWPGPIHEHLTRQAARVPERAAVIDRDGRDGAWSYAELEAASNRLARHLLSRGVGARVGDGEPVRGELGGGAVAIWASRSAPLVWAMMAGLKTGAAVLVLDPAYPGASLVARLALARPRALLRLAGSPPIDPAVSEWLARHTDCALIDLPARPGAEPWASEQDTPPGVTVGPDDAACLSFTSGSTGVPKGIVCLHRSLTHFVPWQGQRVRPERARSLQHAVRPVARPAAARHLHRAPARRHHLRARPGPHGRAGLPGRLGSRAAGSPSLT